MTCPSYLAANSRCLGHLRPEDQDLPEMEDVAAEEPEAPQDEVESDEDPDVLREQISKLEEKLARALARRAR